MKREGGRRALAELKKRFFEQGYTIYSLKRRYRKDDGEFFAAKFLGQNRGAAITRLFREGVRVRFLEGDSPLLHNLKKYLLLGVEEDVSFMQKAWNPTLKGNAYMWDHFVYKRELGETNPVKILSRSGIAISGTFKEASRAH